MAGLKLNHIYKVYENGHKAVNDFSIDIEDKEFIVFVGPSGCGKSTTLRMIAGLEEITAGDLFIGDTLVNDVEPKDRDIAMVFQNYALYPHMTVYDNMAFGLRNRHMPKDEIHKRVMDAAKILDIEEYLDRKPKAMSGGQRQRVALGRAIVRDPKVFLLDEPLSNLDAKLRASMRTEITKLHKKLQTTFIYVTHDQVEAMTMGTRIVVMKLGYVQQIDTPINLYERPRNKFVAGFIGTPQMNFFDVTLERQGDTVVCAFDDGKQFTIPYEVVCKAQDHYLHGKEQVILGVRPDHLRVVDYETKLQAKVNVVEQLGNESIVYGQLALDEELSVKAKNQIIIKVPADSHFESGQIINLEVKVEKINLFDQNTELTLLNDIPDYSKFDAKASNGVMEFLGSKIKMPSAFREALVGHEDIQIQVPPEAVIAGKDYQLEVHKVEVFNGKKLVSLVYGDRYLFLQTDKDVKKGDLLKFSLRYDKLTILDGDEVIVEPISNEESLVGTFLKTKRKAIGLGKTYVTFEYVIEGHKIVTPMDKVVKITSIEGDACYSKQYKYVFKRENIQLVTEGMGIECEVQSIIDYGNSRYAKLVTGGQSLLIEVDQFFNESMVFIDFDGQDIEVYEQDIDMRLC